MDRKTVIIKVKEVLSVALEEYPQDISLADEIEEDLGADSLDFLNIAHGLQAKFGIKTPAEEIFLVNIFRSINQYIENGEIALEGLQEIKERAPFTDLSQFCLDPRVQNISSIFTANHLVNYICWKLGIKVQTPQSTKA